MNQKLHWAVSLFTFIALIFFISYSFLFKPSKVVYVDALTLVSNYQGMKDAKIELEGRISVYKANVDTLKVELDEKIKEYGARKSKLSASETKLFQDLIIAKQQQFENYQQVIQDKIQDENLKLTQNVLSKINDYVMRYGKKNNYELILAATQQGNIIYGTPDVNITNAILEGLNREYQSPGK